MGKEYPNLFPPAGHLLLLPLLANPTWKAVSRNPGDVVGGGRLLDTQRKERAAKMETIQKSWFLDY